MHAMLYNDSVMDAVAAKADTYADGTLDAGTAIDAWQGGVLEGWSGCYGRLGLSV